MGEPQTGKEKKVFGERRRAFCVKAMSAWKTEKERTVRRAETERREVELPDDRKQENGKRLCRR